MAQSGERRMSQEAPASSAIKREDTYPAKIGKQSGRLVATTNTTGRQRREFNASIDRFRQEDLVRKRKVSGDRSMAGARRSVSK